MSGHQIRAKQHIYTHNTHNISFVLPKLFFSKQINVCLAWLFIKKKKETKSSKEKKQLTIKGTGITVIKV